MFDVRHLMDLPPAASINTGGEVQIKSLNCQTVDGAHQLVVNVTTATPQLCVLDVLQNRVFPLRPKLIDGMRFVPTTHNGIQLVWFHARELERLLSLQQYIDLMWSVIKKGASPVLPDGTSHLVARVSEEVLYTTIAQATLTLYNSGIIGGEPLLDALLDSRATLVIGLPREIVKPLLAHIEAAVESRRSASSSCGTQGDDPDMITLILAVTLGLAAIPSSNIDG